MKIYLSKLNESWIVDKIRSEFIETFPSETTSNLKLADVVWVIAPWTLKKRDFLSYKNKKVICSIYHLDESIKNNEDVKQFLKFDKYIDEYHTISKNSQSIIQKFTNKKVTEIPFWINTNDFFEIKNKNELRTKYGFNSKEYLVGSFQRDSEGKNPQNPKLIKGPDIFLNIVKKLHDKNENLKIILTGKRRDFVVNNLKSMDIDYSYFEMVDVKILNELYNLLDLYIVSSRLEGGPQAIGECATTNTPIVSTNVGVAEQILSKDSIFDYKNISSFFEASPNIIEAKKNVSCLETPRGYQPFLEMFRKIYES